MKEYKRSCRLAHPSQDYSEMKYSVILLALVSVALGPLGIQSQSTLPRLGGVNTAGYDFTVVSEYISCSTAHRLIFYMISTPMGAS